MKWLMYFGVTLAMVAAIVVLIGAALPKAHVAIRKIVLDASPADVFALVAGPSDWRGLRYEQMKETPLTWKETDRRGEAITYERVETMAPKRLVNRIADPKLPFGGSWVYELEPSGTGTALTITENGEVYNPLFRFVSRFVMGHAATIEKYQSDLRSHFKN